MNAQTDGAAPPQFGIIKLYLKDVSFESPQSPAVFSRNALQPAIEVQMHVETKAVAAEQGIHEVVLAVTVTAKADNQSLFLAEVQQAGVFHVSGLSAEDLPKALEIACPNVLLPFAREAVADLVGKGGFPQLMLQPVNFETLYQRKREPAKVEAGVPHVSPATH
jgi:preprotein translocase subunit SecB